MTPNMTDTWLEKIREFFARTEHVVFSPDQIFALGGLAFDLAYRGIPAPTEFRSETSGRSPIAMCWPQQKVLLAVSTSADGLFTRLDDHDVPLFEGVVHLKKTGRASFVLPDEFLEAFRPAEREDQEELEKPSDELLRHIYPPVEKE